MDDACGTINPYAAVIARADLEAAREVAPQPVQEFSNIEFVRVVGRFLNVAAEKVGVRGRDFGYDFAALAREIILAAQRGGKLSPGDYRAVWEIRALLTRQPEQTSLTSLTAAPIA
jgi:hypothetical protein